MDTKWWQ